jgi:hypothetical protein
VVHIADPVLRGTTRSGKTILIKQGAVSRTRVESTVPVTVHGKGGEGWSMEESLRSVRRVIREKEGSGISIDAGQDTGSSETRVIRRSSSDSSSGSSAGGSVKSRASVKGSSSGKSSSESKTAVKKKK